MNNQYISTTELREQSSKVVAKLRLGEDMVLVHRSRIIGVIKPISSKTKSIDNLSEFKKVVSNYKPSHIIPYRKRKEIYRNYLKKRYGKDIS